MVAGFAWLYLREPVLAVTTSVHPPGSAVATGRAAIARVLSHWRAPASRLIWICALGIGAFYGVIRTVPLLLGECLGITEHNVGYFVIYLGGMGVVVRALAGEVSSR